MNIRQIGKIAGGQDGAIYGSELFRLNHFGECIVYDISGLGAESDAKLSPKARFKLDLADALPPHSNAVCFGCEFYDESDDYPLLYSNMYNNRASCEDQMIGVCLVYRIQRINGEFHSKLVQMIEIGFCEDCELWKAYPDKHGVRPYGNFVIDNDSRSYWAFVMRNEELGTRYIRFDLPSAHDGETDARFNVKKVVLEKSDIREYFDCEYHRYIQGAILHKGKIYSTEGFTNDEVNRPAIRIIDLDTKQERYFDITKLGLKNEPEFIDFYEDSCFYSDANGNLYVAEF